jgi:SAM-dependent methyltransferase
MIPEDGGYDASYAPILAAAEDRHFWFRARNTVIRAVSSKIETTLPSGYRVIEVGCGTGNTLRVLSAVCHRGSVVGMDSQREGLSFARRRVSSPLFQADIRRLPFGPSVRFDLIGMFDVLEHIPDDVGALNALRARLTAHGVLLLTVPAAPELWSSFDIAARHCRRYTADSLESTLTAAGFEVDYLSPFMASLYPIAWFKRRWQRTREPEAGRIDPVLDDLRIVPLVNGPLARLLALEAPLIAARRRLPFGTSLLAIASSA